MRVLLIEDDVDIRSVLERGLRSEGFDVESCGEGPEGLWRALEGDFDAIILDIMLPKQSGYWVCERLREEGNATPILVLSAKSGEWDQIDMLDLGADDYLVKPAALELVVARLRALVRRVSGAAANVIRRGPVEYDLKNKICLVNGAVVELTAREHQLLQRFVAAGVACINREEILRDVWGVDAEVDPTIVDVYVRKLRDKIAPATIQNVRGVGFRLC